MLKNHIFLIFLQLDRPLNASDAIRAVEFLRTGGTNPDTGAVVETAGWGSLDNLGSRPDKLKEVVINVISPAKCRRSDYFGRKFTNNMLCAHKVCREDCGHSHGMEDSCDVSCSFYPLFFYRNRSENQECIYQLLPVYFCFFRVTLGVLYFTMALPSVSPLMEGKNAAKLKSLVSTLSSLTILNG